MSQGYVGPNPSGHGPTGGHNRLRPTGGHNRLRPTGGHNRLRPTMVDFGQPPSTRDLAAGSPTHHALTSMSTLPTVLASTAAWASRADARGKRCSGSPASSPTASAPSATAADVSATAWSFAARGTV